MSNKWKLFWVASFTLVIFFQACGIHSWEELLISTSDEKRMGREFDSLVRRGGPNDVMAAGETVFTPSTDAERALFDFYLARGKEVVGKIRTEDMNGLLPSEDLCRDDNGATASQKKKCTKSNFFEFKIIKSNTVNAFAVPGGYVYFYTAIMKGSKGFQTESELMSVMGHEIGHVVLHHSRDGMIKAAGASAILDIFLGDGVAGLVGLLGAQYWLAGNSQGNESQADSMGFYYTNELQISSAGLSDFFDRGLIKKADGTCDKAANASAADVFSTHPPSCERVIANNKRIRDANQNFPKDRHNPTFKQLVTAAGI